MIMASVQVKEVTDYPGNRGTIAWDPKYAYVYLVIQIIGSVVNNSWQVVHNKS
ncbi:hypothetical protein D3C73_769870 [compost metagenome]